MGQPYLQVKEYWLSYEVWFAGAGLIVTISFSAGGIIWKLAEVRAVLVGALSEVRLDMEKEITANRLAAIKEYDIIRREAHETSGKTYREFGEGLAAARTKITEVELWVRDQMVLYLLKSDYLRGQETISDQLRSLGETIDRRFGLMEKKLDRRLGDDKVG